jgi:hypothetical protein
MVRRSSATVVRSPLLMFFRRRNVRPQEPDRPATSEPLIGTPPPLSGFAVQRRRGRSARRIPQPLRWRPQRFGGSRFGESVLTLAGPPEAPVELNSQQHGLLQPGDLAGHRQHGRGQRELIGLAYAVLELATPCDQRCAHLTGARPQSGKLRTSELPVGLAAC